MWVVLILKHSNLGILNQKWGYLQRREEWNEGGPLFVDLTLEIPSSVNIFIRNYKCIAKFKEFTMNTYIPTTQIQPPMRNVSYPPLSSFSTHRLPRCHRGTSTPISAHTVPAAGPSGRSYPKDYLPPTRKP